MVNELKPCPFCGSEVRFICDSISIKCPNCGCAFIATNPLLSRRDVAGYWNKRERQTVDVVPVVRCKDCKYYSNNGYQKCRLHSTEPDQYGPGADVCMEPDDFCSCGERKDDGC